ncbi:hypothetical protein BD560DRAFT_411898 [Blakeslea trispora]|nr:hypothetical protein BD560DRAFT_411898 [Blakeslea trispora]
MSVGNFDTYMDLKLLERSEKMEMTLIEVRGDKKKHFFFFTWSTTEALRLLKQQKKLDAPRHTAYDWFKREEGAARKWLKEPQLVQEEKVRHLKVLNDEHTSISCFRDATINEAMKSLTSQFKSLKISKTVVHDFMVNDCALIIKNGRFENKEILLHTSSNEQKI